MNIKQLADQLGVAPNTIRNWTSVYGEYLTPGANPPQGQRRTLSDHDLRVFAYVTAMKDAGHEQDEIVERLDTMQNGGWNELPEVPGEWNAADDTISLVDAANRAGSIAQLAVLQKELQYTHQELDVARGRVKDLETKLEAKAEVEAEKVQLQVALERAKADVSRLEGVLSSYSFGREKPINVGLIVVTALLVGALLVILAFVVARLLM